MDEWILQTLLIVYYSCLVYRAKSLALHTLNCEKEEDGGRGVWDVRRDGGAGRWGGCYHIFTTLQFLSKPGWLRRER